MHEMRKVALKVAWSHMGRFYIWGGDDPSGFDCSGFVIEVLKSVGVLPRSGDWTADGLMRKFGSRAVSSSGEGRLVFWLDDGGRAVHVEFCIGHGLAMGASGGGSGTNTVEDAIRQNAFIKVRSIDSRRGPKVYVDPFGAFQD